MKDKDFEYEFLDSSESRLAIKLSTTDIKLDVNVCWEYAKELMQNVDSNIHLQSRKKYLRFSYNCINLN